MTRTNIAATAVGAPVTKIAPTARAVTRTKTATTAGATPTAKVAAMAGRVARTTRLMRPLQALVAALVLGLFSTHSADAHPLDLGYLRITTAGDSVSVQLDVELSAAALLLGTDAAPLDAHTITARADDLAMRSFGREPIMTPSGPCRFGAASATLVGRTVSISSSAQCPHGGARHWNFPLVGKRIISPRFQIMAKQTIRGSEQLTLVDPGQPTLDIAVDNATSNVGFGHFVRTGVEHIGAAPNQWKAPGGGWQLPDGIDHILFLLALVICGGRFMRLAGIASGFTLGHSITLALAALNVVRPPASIIEPLIALSIAVAAAEAYSDRLANHRWKIATGFGLIHGFGFATALSHLELSTRGKATALLGFNVGVELGQLVIVLLTAPLIMLIHRNERIGRPVTRVAAGIIFMCGVYWFVRRLIG